MVNSIIVLLILLQIKHFICDFLLQYNWQAFNKHNLFHPGGYVHAGIHVIGTFVAFWLHMIIMSGGFYHLGTLWNFIWVILLAEFIAHYTIDFCKMNLNRFLGWGPSTCKEFWDLLGFDQLLHQSCYIAMIYYYAS